MLGHYLKGRANVPRESGGHDDPSALDVEQNPSPALHEYPVGSHTASADEDVSGACYGYTETHRRIAQRRLRNRR